MLLKINQRVRFTNDMVVGRDILRLKGQVGVVKAINVDMSKSSTCGMVNHLEVEVCIHYPELNDWKNCIIWSSSDETRAPAHALTDLELIDEEHELVERVKTESKEKLAEKLCEVIGDWIDDLDPAFNPTEQRTMKEDVLQALLEGYAPGDDLS